MDKLIESLSGLFKWSGESSWTGIVKSMVVIAFLVLMGLSGYLAYIGFLSWTWVLVGLRVIIASGIIFILFNRDVFNKFELELKRFLSFYLNLPQFIFILYFLYFCGIIIIEESRVERWVKILLIKNGILKI